MPTLTDGLDLALAVTEDCMNKIAAIAYHAGILPTEIDGDLTPVAQAVGCLGALLGRRPAAPPAGAYTYHVQLHQASFDFAGQGVIRATGGADASIVRDGAVQTAISFSLTLPLAVSLVAPGSRPQDPDVPQVQVALGQPEAQVSGLPPALQWVLEPVAAAVKAFFANHVLSLPAFPAFFAVEGYGVELGGLDVTTDQLVLRASLLWPGRPAQKPAMARVPFTFRRPRRLDAPMPAPAAAAGESTLAPAPRYRLGTPAVRPGDITWPAGGLGYDIALAVNQKPIGDILAEKFPLKFSADLGGAVRRVDFTLDARLDLIDAAVDQIKLTGEVTAANSSSAEIACTADAEVSLGVALVHSADAVKGRLAGAGVHVKAAGCREKLTGADAGASKLVNWLAYQTHLMDGVNGELVQRFGDAAIPLTFTLFKQQIDPSGLSVAVAISNAEIVQDEIQAWITIAEATAPAWHWPPERRPAIHE